MKCRGKLDTTVHEIFRVYLLHFMFYLVPFYLWDSVGIQNTGYATCMLFDAPFRHKFAQHIFFIHLSAKNTISYLRTIGDNSFKLVGKISFLY